MRSGGVAKCGMPNEPAYNFINAESGYQADFGRSTAIICARPN
jgi:hypothetical protein